jgi:SPP1 family predicted phage head-tail adaptor
MPASLVFKSLRNNTFSVERRSRTSDGQGGWTIGYVATGDVLGRIRPASSTEQQIALAEGRQISHVLYVEAGEDLERGDRVTCGDLVVEVMAVREPSLADHHWSIDCLERQVEETV